MCSMRLQARRSAGMAFTLCRLSLLLLILLSLANSSHAWHDPYQQAREDDLVVDLPGQPEVSFAQYAGYVTVNATHGRALFYWFFEATSTPESKPLLLWLNGGPGCSSVGYGAAEEIGPLRVKVNGTGLEYNKDAWNNDVNLLFVESPAGVGFSYSNTSSDYGQYGDTLTALDCYSFLARWFERFPRYRSRGFYLAGESYAGHYVPQLAELIYDRNKETYPVINLKGLMIGNPKLDDSWDALGIVEYAWSHAVISDQTYQGLKNACNFFEQNLSEACDSFLITLSSQYSVIDIYSLYTDNCLADETTGSGSGKITQASMSRRFPLLGALHGRIPYRAGYDPCMDDYVFAYLNRPDVQKALHANTTSVPYVWSPCSVVLSNWTDSPDSVLPTLKKLIAGGLRVWVYSGDTDGRIPFISTRYSVEALKLPIQKTWYPWYHKKQVGGWTQVYEGLTYVTVRGAGHLVPVFKPGRALAMLRSFLAGNPLPDH